MRGEPGSGRAALISVIAVLSVSVALLAIAVIARLRDPRAVAPNRGDLSELLGTGKGRPSWRVLLIALAVIVAWLLIVTLLIRYLVPHAVTPAAQSPAPAAPPSAHPTGPPPQQHPQNNSGDMFGIGIEGLLEESKSGRR